jgi:hypothetical protein
LSRRCAGSASIHLERASALGGASTAERDADLAELSTAEAEAAAELRRCKTCTGPE